MNKWKSANDVDKYTKVFIISKGYGDLRREMESRGWIENEDPKSICFNMKWMVKIRDIPFNKIGHN
jgi:hypothetical protein